MTPGLDILIVDDEPIICTALKKILQKKNHRVTTALNGREALRLTEGKAFHCALIDLCLPDMEGRDLPVRMLSHNPEMCFIMISGDSFTDSPDIFRAIPSVLSCEDKPLNFPDIVQLLSLFEKTLSNPPSPS